MTEKKVAKWVAAYHDWPEKITQISAYKLQVPNLLLQLQKWFFEIFL